ncbi:hypothetical protein CsatB_014773 [Cannabis sativa]
MMVLLQRTERESNKDQDLKSELKPRPCSSSLFAVAEAVADKGATISSADDGAPGILLYIFYHF